jgi:hypothetical protein
MESFSLNSAKSFIGKNVNLHLKDGSVIVNVHLTHIKKASVGKANLIEYVPYGNRKFNCIPLRNVAWAELLNINLMAVPD